MCKLHHKVIKHLGIIQLRQIYVIEYDYGTVGQNRINLQYVK